MGFLSKVIPPLVVAFLAYTAYDIVYGDISTNQMLLHGFQNRARNRAAMNAFATSLYTDAGAEILAGKTIVVTGTTSGLGEGIAAHLYEASPPSTTLVFPVRSSKKHTAEAIAARLEPQGVASRQQYAPDTARAADSPRARIISVTQDLSDLDSIDASVRSLKEQGIVADILINNAGLAPINWQLTKQGFDLAMGVNHFGTAHFTLQLQLQGLLAEGAEGSGQRGRVVMVSSEEHRLPKHRFDDSAGPAFGEPVEHGMAGAMDRYADSKLALTTFSMELADRWKDKVTVYDMCPGPVASSIAQDTPIIGDAIVWVMRKIFPSKYEAALPVLRLALDPSYEHIVGDVHHHMAEPSRAAPFAVDKGHRSFVFERTVDLLANRGPPQQA